MIRMNSLRNLPVICNGKQIGLMQEITLDDKQKQVNSLVVSCGIRGKRIIARNQIVSIANGFILAKNAEKYRYISGTNTYRFVRDTTGLLTGRIIDYALDRNTLQVYAIEIQTGYVKHSMHRKIWVYDYGQCRENRYELIIPASLGSELIISEEVNRIAHINNEGNCSRKLIRHYNGRWSDDDAPRKTNETRNGKKWPDSGQTACRMLEKIT